MRNTQSLTVNSPSGRKAFHNFSPDRTPGMDNVNVSGRGSDIKGEKDTNFSKSSPMLANDSLTDNNDRFQVDSLQSCKDIILTHKLPP